MRKKKMLTTNEIAERYDVAYSTVILWIKSGKLEGAVKEPNPRGDIWLVPESSVKSLKRRQKGRPKKAQGSDANESEKRGGTK
jgi:predicted site-specific integrase-resolvase